MTLIELENVSKKFNQGQTVIKAVDQVNLKIQEGEFWVIIGASGSGKSTMLQLLGCLEKPSEGKITVDDIDIGKASERKLTRIRGQKIGFIFQNFNLLPTLTASQNIEAAIVKRSKNDKKRIKELLELVGLGNRGSHLPNLLSGGEQQRVAIARSLVNCPRIILADEPTGNLDSKTGTEIMEILHELNQKEKITVILVTHSDYVKSFATHVAEMKDGKLSLLNGKK